MTEWTGALRPLEELGGSVGCNRHDGPGSYLVALNAGGLADAVQDLKETAAHVNI